MKFTLALAAACARIGASVWVSAGWLRDLAPVTGSVLAWVITILVADLPRATVAFSAVALMLGRQPALCVAPPTTALTAIIAARNEERGIGETIAALGRTDHSGPRGPAAHHLRTDPGKVER